MTTKETTQDTSPAAAVTVAGKVPNVSAAQLKLISAYLVQNQSVLLEAPVTASGTFPGFQWTFKGVPLSDGPGSFGETFSGTATPARCGITRGV